MKITGSNLAGVGGVPPVGPSARLDKDAPRAQQPPPEPAENQGETPLKDTWSIEIGPRSSQPEPEPLYGPDGRLRPPGRSGR